jgi:hypothetical protein
MARKCLRMRPYQGFVGGDAAAQCGGAPPFQVVGGVGRVDDAVEVAELSFEFPGAPEPVAVAAQRAEEGVVALVKPLFAGAERVAGAAPVPAAGPAVTERDARRFGAGRRRR